MGEHLPSSRVSSHTQSWNPTDGSSKPAMPGHARSYAHPYPVTHRLLGEGVGVDSSKAPHVQAEGHVLHYRVILWWNERLGSDFLKGKQLSIVTGRGSLTTLKHTSRSLATFEQFFFWRFGGGRKIHPHARVVTGPKNQSVASRKKRQLIASRNTALSNNTFKLTIITTTITFWITGTPHPTSRRRSAATPQATRAAAHCRTSPCGSRTP